MYDIIIIGGGPAGLTAATYARRAGKSALVIEKASFGGQIAWSPKVENFPGKVTASGAEIADSLLDQAMTQGADVELEEITHVKRTVDRFILTSASGVEYSSKALIAATGARPRKLGLAREEELTGNGVCFCAVCDGAFFKGRSVAVYGGGNSALQDAMLLSETCSRVFLIHRRDSFRGEARLVEALHGRKNVDFITGSTVTRLIGNSELTGVEIAGRGGASELPVEGLFVAIGHEPDNMILSSYMQLDGNGYADSDETCLTKTPGLFVAGDCRKKSVRQCATACADGAVAALAACSWIGA